MKATEYILPKFEIMKKYILIFSILILELSGVCIAQTITAPSNLEAEFEVPGYVKVKWDDNSNNEDGFLIERALISDSLQWETIGQSTQNSQRFDDYWILLNRIYYYRVYAYNSLGRSDYSNEDTASTSGDTTNIPGTPSNLRVVKTTLNSVKIQWNDNASNEFGFIIARKRPNISYFEFIDSVGTDVLTYQEVGLTPDNVYFYKVCAYNSFGISDYTNTVSARTEESSLIQISSSQTDSYFLRDNYPNPFNPSTVIEFGITSRSLVKLTVFNSAGIEVATLFSGELPAGTYSNRWIAGGIPSGTYFYRLEVFSETKGAYSETKKMVLIK